MANISFDQDFRAPSGTTVLSFHLDPNETGIDRIITVTLEDDNNMGYQKTFTVTQQRSENPNPFAPGSPVAFNIGNLALGAHKMYFSGDTVTRFYYGNFGPFVLNQSENGYVVGE